MTTELLSPISRSEGACGVSAQVVSTHRTQYHGRPLVIAVDIASDESAVEPLRAAIATDRGIAAVAPAEVDLAAGVAAIVAISTSAPQDAATVQTIDRLRSMVFPTVLNGTATRAHVGGQTASSADSVTG